MDEGEGESGAEEEGNENPRRNMIDEEIFLIHRDTAPWLPLLSSPPPSLDPDSAPDPPPSSGDITSCHVTSESSHHSSSPDTCHEGLYLSAVGGCNALDCTTTTRAIRQAVGGIEEHIAMGPRNFISFSDGKPRLSPWHCILPSHSHSSRSSCPFPPPPSPHF